MTPFVFGGLGFIPIWGRDAERKPIVRGWAVVDACDFPDVACFRWHLSDGGYAMRWYGGRPPKRKCDRMHRRLLGLAQGDGRQGDHINNIRLDNRRSNLRIVSGDSQNKQNVPSRGGTSRYRGVSYDARRNRWMAQAKCEGKRLARSCMTEEEAAEVSRLWRAEHMPYATD